LAQEGATATPGPKKGAGIPREGPKPWPSLLGAVGVGLVPPRLPNSPDTPLAAYIKRWRGAPKMHL
jgi:hypothetical protein